MPHSTQAASRKPAMRAVVSGSSGADQRDCMVWDATPSGCRISGNLDGLPDLLTISVAGVAQPMKGRVVSRETGCLAVTFAWWPPPESEADPADGKTVEEPVELDKAVEPDPATVFELGQSSADMSDEEVMDLYFRLEKSLLARLD